MFDYQIVGRFEVYQKFADWNLPDHEQILFHPVLKLQAIYSAKLFFIIGNELIVYTHRMCGNQHIKRYRSLRKIHTIAK